MSGNVRGIMLSAEKKASRCEAFFIIFMTLLIISHPVSPPGTM